MDELSLEIQGLKETQAALEKATAALTGPPMLAGMRRATLLVQGAAKRKAPVDTGRLRASITPEVQTRADGVVGIVGSNVKYAPFVELGTRRHFVPGQYIGRWARRHGLPEGGLVVSGKAQPFLQPAFEENAERIFQTLGTAVSIIVTEAGNG